MNWTKRNQLDISTATKLRLQTGGSIIGFALVALIGLIWLISSLFQTDDRLTSTQTASGTEFILILPPQDSLVPPARITPDSQTGAIPLIPWDSLILFMGNEPRLIEGSDSGPVSLTWRNEETITLTIADDPAPRLSWRAQPRFSQDGNLLLDFDLTDPMGTGPVALILAPTLNNPGSSTDRYRIPLPHSALPPGHRNTAFVRQIDLTNHPLHGRPVSLFLSVQDQAGQLSETGQVFLVLRKKRFRSPLAQIIAKQADRLENNGAISVPGIVKALSALTRFDQGRDMNAATHLGLRQAYRMLTLPSPQLSPDGPQNRMPRSSDDLTPALMEEVAQLLTETATGEDEGSLGLASHDMNSLFSKMRTDLFTTSSMNGDLIAKEIIPATQTYLWALWKYHRANDLPVYIPSRPKGKRARLYTALTQAMGRMAGMAGHSPALLQLQILDDMQRLLSDLRCPSGATKLPAVSSNRNQRIDLSTLVRHLIITHCWLGPRLAQSGGPISLRQAIALEDHLAFAARQLKYQPAQVAAPIATRLDKALVALRSGEGDPNRFSSISRQLNQAISLLLLYRLTDGLPSSDQPLHPWSPWQLDEAATRKIKDDILGNQAITAAEKETILNRLPYPAD